MTTETKLKPYLKFPHSNVEKETIEEVIPTVNLIEGEYRMNSLDIARSLGIQHKSLLETVKKYEHDLNEFGRVAFEKRPLPSRGGVQVTTFYLLNENQCIFVALLSRNRPKVVAFKKAVVCVFEKARKANLDKTITVPASWVLEQTEMNRQFTEAMQSMQQHVFSLETLVIDLMKQGQTLKTTDTNPNHY